MSKTNRQGGEAHSFALDVTDLDKLPAFFDTLRENLMPNILVNNAGMNVVKPALDYTPDDYRQVLDTNLTACFFLPMNLPATISSKAQPRVLSTSHQWAVIMCCPASHLTAPRNRALL